MQFSRAFVLAASLAISFAAPAPAPTTDTGSEIAAPEPTSVPTESKSTTPVPVHDLAALGGWESICKDYKNVGDQICQSCVSS